MIRLLLTGAILSLSATASVSQNVRYIGSFCLTSVTPGCASEGWAVGNCTTFHLKPPNIGSNGPETKMSVFFPVFALNYSLSSGTLVGTTYKTTTSTAIGLNATSFPADVRFVTQSPATLTATTKFISINGNIKDFDDPLFNCDVGFRASAQQRP